VEEHPLELAAASLRLRVDFVSEQPKPSYTSPSSASVNLASKLFLIEQTHDFCLAERPPQLPRLQDRRLIKQGASDSRAGDAVNLGDVSRGQPTIPMRCDALRAATAAVRRDDVDLVAALFPKPPQRRRRAVRQDGAWPTSKNRRHQHSIGRKSGIANREDSVVHSMQTTGHYTR
jgi:hypothetical protein